MNGFEKAKREREEIQRQSEARYAEVAQRLFDEASAWDKPYKDRNGKITLPDGLYAMKIRDGSIELFHVHHLNSGYAGVYTVGVDVNGELYSRWYSELSNNFKIAPHMISGATLKQCSDSAYKKLYEWYKANTQQMQEVWENS